MIPVSTAVVLKATRHASAIASAPVGAHASAAASWLASSRKLGAPAAAAPAASSATSAVSAAARVGSTLSSSPKHRQLVAPARIPRMCTAVNARKSAESSAEARRPGATSTATPVATSSTAVARPRQLLAESFGTPAQRRMIAPAMTRTAPTRSAATSITTSTAAWPRRAPPQDPAWGCLASAPAHGRRARLPVLRWWTRR